MLKFIKRNEGVTKLSLLPIIDDWDDLTASDLESVLASLPKLLDLEFCGDMFTEGELIRLLSENNGLEKVKLWFLELPKWYHFQNAVEVEWTYTAQSVKAGYYYIELERKTLN